MNQGESAAMVGSLRGAGFDVTRVLMRELTRERLHEWLEEVREARES